MINAHPRMVKWLKANDTWNMQNFYNSLKKEKSIFGDPIAYSNEYLFLSNKWLVVTLDPQESEYERGWYIFDLSMLKGSELRKERNEENFSISLQQNGPIKVYVFNKSKHPMLWENKDLDTITDELEKIAHEKELAHYYDIEDEHDRWIEHDYANDDRSNSINPNNPAFKASQDNRSKQLNPRHRVFHSSRKKS